MTPDRNRGLPHGFHLPLNLHSALRVPGAPARRGGCVFGLARTGTHQLRTPACLLVRRHAIRSNGRLSPDILLGARRHVDLEHAR